VLPQSRGSRFVLKTANYFGDVPVLEKTTPPASDMNELDFRQHIGPKSRAAARQTILNIIPLV